MLGSTSHLKATYNTLKLAMHYFNLTCTCQYMTANEQVPVFNNFTFEHTMLVDLSIVFEIQFTKIYSEPKS